MTDDRDYYDELGVRPGADPDELRRAYRERARVLHPDASGDAAAMRRLNEAWRVLGSAESRRRYDERMGLGLVETSQGASSRNGEETTPINPEQRGHTPFARPGLWFLMVAVLLLIFVFTAYAGGGAGGRVP
ncbi:MAG TPA: J domain-containing protein [Acidimicrobiales bacterium]|nr:J domain-containing protein [Acidimicrobiales bacterium]